MTTPDLQSRAKLAGYDPAVLEAARVLVVGAGALGQNLLQDLALSGVGQLAVVDPDAFEPHNATRSPYFAAGEAKAPAVARGVRRAMTATRPRVLVGESPVQQVGDAAIAWADVVCAAVDNARARAWLAERCRVAGTPLVEAGFAGSALNLSVFGPEVDEPCYRCLHPHLDGALSCRAYAAAAVAHDVVPAIQSGAAALGALQAEQAIACLHGEAPLRGRRLYLDVRSGRASLVSLVRSAGCPGVHRRPELLELAVHASDRVGVVWGRLVAELGVSALRLPAAVVVAASCTACGEPVAVGAPDWRWLVAPRCTACDGPWPSAGGLGPVVADWLTADLVGLVADYRLADLGAPPGALLQVDVGEDDRLVRVSGTVEAVLSAA